MNRILFALAACILLVSSAFAGSLTTTFDLNGAADGMMFDLTAKSKLTIAGFAYRPWPEDPGILHTIEVYYVTDRTTYEGKETDPSLWTLMGTKTVETAPYPPAVQVDIGGLTMHPGETIGIYFTDIGVAPTNVARRSGPLGVFENEDLIFEDRGAAKFYPFGQTFTPRVWCGTIYYEVITPPCPADINGDATVDVLDLLLVLAAWGATSGPEDINGDGIVDVLDLLELLAAWGPC